jgi:hypothetical protein
MERYYINCLGKTKVKPIVGDLVKLNDDFAYVTPGSSFVRTGTGDTGVIVGAWGIHVTILWSQGQKSSPERGCIEVLSEYR